MKLKEKIIKKLPFPPVNFDRPSELAKDIEAFYNAICPNPDETIDVRDVVISAERTREILLRLTRHEEVRTSRDRLSIRFFWLQYGPSNKPDVPYNEVWIRGYVQ